LLAHRRRTQRATGAAGSLGAPAPARFAPRLLWPSTGGNRSPGSPRRRAVARRSRARGPPKASGRPSERRDTAADPHAAACPGCAGAAAPRPAAYL